jgi:hypothetical protein
MQPKITSKASKNVENSMEIDALTSSKRSPREQGPARADIIEQASTDGKIS